MPEKKQDPPSPKCKKYIVRSTIYLSILVLISPNIVKQDEPDVNVAPIEIQCKKTENIHNIPENTTEVNPFATVNTDIQISSDTTITKEKEQEIITLINPLIAECEKAACLAGTIDGEKGIYETSLIIKECNDEQGDLISIFYSNYDECNSIAYVSLYTSSNNNSNNIKKEKEIDLVKKESSNIEKIPKRVDLIIPNDINLTEDEISDISETKDSNTFSVITVEKKTIFSIKG